MKRYVYLVAEIKNKEDENLKKCAKSIKNLTQTFCDDIIRLLRRKYSSLVFRNLIQAHCCLLFNEESQENDKKVEIQSKNVPKSNRKQFNDLMLSILKIPNISGT